MPQPDYVLYVTAMGRAGKELRAALPTSSPPESAMIQAKRISHATFETPDIDRQIDYFTEIVGLVLAERANGRAYLATKVGDLAVQLEKGGQSRCTRIAFQVAPDTDVDDIRRGIESENV